MFPKGIKYNLIKIRCVYTRRPKKKTPIDNREQVRRSNFN